jgi:hypothetical protein
LLLLLLQYGKALSVLTEYQGKVHPAATSKTGKGVLFKGLNFLITSNNGAIPSRTLVFGTQPSWP